VISFIWISANISRIGNDMCRTNEQVSHSTLTIRSGKTLIIESSLNYVAINWLSWNSYKRPLIQYLPIRWNWSERHTGEVIVNPLRLPSRWFILLSPISRRRTPSPLILSRSYIYQPSPDWPLPTNFNISFKWTPVQQKSPGLSQVLQYLFSANLFAVL